MFLSIFPFRPSPPGLPGFAALAAGLCGLGIGSVAGEPSAADWDKVKPVLAKYCYDCHGGKKTKGDANLKLLDNAPGVAAHFELWGKVQLAMVDGEMPPEDDPQPNEAEKKLVLDWLKVSMDAVANENSGDPGLVTIRRLTNVEYDNSIRDLTGIDYGLAKKFQPDGGGGEGFTNTGDVLFVSPQQLDSYFAAARHITDHASILPGRGIRFSKERVGLRSPVQLRTEASQSLYIWYQKMAAPHLPRDGEDRREDEYMLAAWKYKHREMTGTASLAKLAKEAGLDPAFLDNWWELLNSEKPQSRFLDLIRIPWRELPAPTPGKTKGVPPAVRQGILDIESKHLSWNKRKGEGWLRTQRRQQDTDGLRTRSIFMTIPDGEPLHLVAGDFGDGNEGDLILFEDIEVHYKGKKQNYADWLRQRISTLRKELEPLRAKPGSARAGNPEVAKLQVFLKSCQSTLARFGKHPQEGRKIGAKHLAVRPPEVIRLPWDDGKVRVRVSAKMDLDYPGAEGGSHQWTIAGANPPDPASILHGALVIYKRQTPIAGRIMWEFSRMKDAFPDEYPRLLQQVARNYLRGGKGSGVYYLNDEQLRKVLDGKQRRRHDQMLRDWALLKNTKPGDGVRQEMDKDVLAHLQRFAFRAWRRELAGSEKEGITTAYQDARGRGLDAESSAREVLTRILVSPDFLFKLEESGEPGIQPVSLWELATRLSYFLWASTPDAQLLQAAKDGRLSTPEGRAEQVTRMLADSKSAGLAREFSTQLFEIHGFESHNSVDAKSFPGFTPGLRADMMAESLGFFEYIVCEDRPVQEILLADYTFLNERLARHYGIPGITGGGFRKVPVSKYQRGGVLGMGSVLTKTSYPQRTSPVRRGNWLLTKVLGMTTPPPPNNVPELDAVIGAKTLREKLFRHRTDEACASCHDKIDPLGFSLEAFDAIGRLRTHDDTGQPVDDSAALRDGTTFKGITGLRDYLGKNGDHFNGFFARKLVGYATGRAVIPTDRGLVNSITAQLGEGEGKFSVAVQAIVGSRQFLTRRNEAILSE